jgi:hypothetical protein
MKKEDVAKLAELHPHQRADLLLSMGAELRKKRRKAPAKGTLPTALRRDSIAQGAAAPIIEHLHGIRGAAPHLVTGMRSTGRILNTSAGAVQDLVLTPRARKAYAANAMDTSQDRSVNDLAIRQCALGMVDSHPLARCCAAYAYWQATESSDAVLPILLNASKSDDEEERILAAHCLASVSPKHMQALQGVAADDKPHSPINPVQESMTVVIHGTFAKDSDWYKPGGDFHEYIKNTVYSDVYSGQDFYFWSGRYTLDEKKLEKIWRAAARKLVSWCTSHPTKKLRLIAHSHGNNVVNMATRMNLPACTLIQLSPPVRDWNLPDMQKVSSGRIFNFHSRIDLVVKIDGGAQNYADTPIASASTQRKVAFSGHSKPHEEKVWENKKLPKLVASVCP